MLAGALAYSSAKRRIAQQGGTVRVPNSLPENLDTLVREAMEEWQVPGLALAVARDGEPDWVKAYGLRDVEAGLPVTVDTQFILCSVTKSFTALGLAMLVDEGRLDWAKPVRDYLPEFRLHDTVATEGVTTIDLLCHSTGLPRHDWLWMPGDISRAEMLSALRYLEPSKGIRAAYQYCNLGYVAAGMVTERIAGQTWEDFTRERIISRPAWASSRHDDALVRNVHLSELELIDVCGRDDLGWPENYFTFGTDRIFAKAPRRESISFLTGDLALRQRLRAIVGEVAEVLYVPPDVLNGPVLNVFLDQRRWG
jgi:hypothetical protein